MKRKLDSDVSGGGSGSGKGGDGGLTTWVSRDQGFSPALEALKAQPLPLEEGDLLRILCFNVGSLKQRVEDDAFIPLLVQTGAHLVLLQEVKKGTPGEVTKALCGSSLSLVKDPQQSSLVSASVKAGTKVLTMAPGSSGTCTLLAASRCPTKLGKVVRVRNDLPPGMVKGAGLTDTEAFTRVVTVFFGPPSYIAIVNVYTPNSGDDEKNKEKRGQWDSAFLKYILALQAGDASQLVWVTTPKPFFGAAAAAAAGGGGGVGIPPPLDPFDYAPYRGRIVVAGDLNTIPTDLDIIRPPRHVAGCSKSERDNFDALLKEGGLQDVFRTRHPAPQQGFTFAVESWRGMGLLAARFDHFLVSTSLMGAVCGYEVLKLAPSGDHLPMVLTLDLSKLVGSASGGSGSGSSGSGSGSSGSGGASEGVSGSESGGGGEGKVPLTLPEEKRETE